MRRFEQVTENGVRFWEIEVVGSELTMRSGKVGQKSFPDERLESYRNATQASREADSLIKKRLAAGFSEIVAHSAAAELEDKLANGDDAAWAVFADQLLSNDDPRGTLIALQRKHGKKRAGKKEIDAFIEDNAEQLLGSLHDYEDQLELDWKNGFLEDVWVFCKPVRWNETDEQKSIDQLLPVLLEHESSRFLRTLRLGWPEPDADSNYEAAVDALIAADWPNHLRQLVVGDFSDSAALSFRADYEDPEWLETETQTDLWPELRSLSPLAARCRDLESLRVRANLRRLGTLDLPKLKHLELSGQHLDPAIVDELRQARLPSLTGLCIEVRGSPNFDLRSLQQIADGTIFPGLTWLGISGLGTGALDVIARSRLWPKLQVVDLSANGFRDEHLDLFRNLSVSHLKKVIFRRNELTKVGTRELKELIPQADVANQRSQRRSRWEREDGYEAME